MEKDNKKARWHIIFEGRVQGVGFRYSASVFARELKLTGFVRNLPNGDVELEAQGDVANIRALIIRLKSKRPIFITRFSVTELPLDESERVFRSSSY